MTWENIDGIFLPNHRCSCGNLNIIANESISPIEREDLKQDLLGMMSDANKIVNGEWGQCACNFGLLAINQTGFAKSI